VKYDPEEQKKSALLKKLETSPAAPTVKADSKRGGSIGESFIFGAGKVIDKLANGIIGDQPELLNEIE